MNDVDFGLDIQEDSLLLRVLHEGRKTDYFTGRQHLYQAYETSMGVFDHLTQALRDDNVTLDPHAKRPLSSVAMHFAEDTTSTSILYHRFELFRDRKVYATTGLNWVQFLELPRDQCDMVLLACGRQLEKEAQVTNRVLADLGH